MRVIFFRHRCDNRRLLSRWSFCLHRCNCRYCVMNCYCFLAC